MLNKKMLLWFWKKKMSPFELIRSPREYVYRSEITPHKKKKTNIKEQRPI